MKSILLSLALIATAQFASATTPMKPAVLTITTSVFWAPPGMTGSYVTLVTKDGHVLYFDNNNRVTEIAFLSDSAMKNLLKKIEAVKPGKLVPDREGPECMDAPTTTTEITQQSGTQIIVAQESGCIDSAVETGYDVRSLANMIQNLSNNLK